jgi:hypothetical protein
MPAPSTFGKAWESHQETDDPLFNCLRPISAQGLPPALMNPIFGEFLDLVDAVQLDSITCDSVLELIRTMSNSYRGTSTTGEAKGKEAERARILRKILLKLMSELMINPPSTLEPASVSLASGAATDGSFALHDSQGRKVSQILIIEVKVGDLLLDMLVPIVSNFLMVQEDFGQGGGSNPMMQLLAYYGRLVCELHESAACQQSCFPSLGLEVYG